MRRMFVEEASSCIGEFLKMLFFHQVKELARDRYVMTVALDGISRLGDVIDMIFFVQRRWIDDGDFPRSKSNDRSVRENGRFG